MTFLVGAFPYTHTLRYPGGGDYQPAKIGLGVYPKPIFLKLNQRSNRTVSALHY